MNIRNHHFIVSALTAVVLTASIETAGALTRENMTAYCVGEVAGTYGTRPKYVKAGDIVEESDGGFSISGTVDKGNEGIKEFKCRFDSKLNFIDVMAMTSDGE